MIDRQKLLSDLQGLLRTVEADLLARSEDAELPEVSGWLKAEYGSAKEAGRTAQTLKSWVDDFVTQVAAAWVLSCVFVRYLEDNALVDPPRIAGPASDAGGGQSRLKRARDEYDHWVQNNRGQTDREYLLDIFSTLAALPAAGEVFGPHNPLNALPNWLSGDSARAMLAFFQKVDSDTGEITHDFTDASGDTRFLGDLYQDLSEAARKKYALLQTPDFVEEFILDRTLEPALDEFGLTPQPQIETGSPRPASGRGAGGEGLFRMIDPACGSGHFLLGSFPRILDRWLKKEPGEKIRVLVQRALDSIHGVDVNPYAIAIARFRLLLAALAACDCKKLKDAPQFKIHLACGDSLYHGRQTQLMLKGIETDESHYFKAEDSEGLRQILREGSFNAVVANPPYITPKDSAANAVYRQLYSTCHREYSLAVPFTQRLYDMSCKDGYVGIIMSNAFAKRLYGEKLVQEFIPSVDLSHIIDTSSAYIPGHGNPDGTPTCILFIRHRAKVGSNVRCVFGKKKEVGRPSNLREGKVWKSIVGLVDSPGTENDYVTVDDLSFKRFTEHPWSLGGGRRATLFDFLQDGCGRRLGDSTSEIGYSIITGGDDFFLVDAPTCNRHAIAQYRDLSDGDAIRNWICSPDTVTFWPNDEIGERLPESELVSYLKFAWCYRTNLKARKAFGVPVEKKGIPWWAIRELYKSKLTPKRSIACAFLETHNQFALVESDTVFKQTAPVIKLSNEASDVDYDSLLATLNSSVCCFWARMALFARRGDDAGRWGEFMEFDSSKLRDYPLPAPFRSPLASQTRIAATQLDALYPRKLSPRAIGELSKEMVAHASAFSSAFGLLVHLQEDLDWEFYSHYSIVDIDLSGSDHAFPVFPGQRAFEIVLARKMAAGKVQSTWFERHGSTPITELPEHWPDDYKALVNRRIEIIESDPNIALIEQPEYKRRWNTESWESQVERALQSWLLDRLESYFDVDGRMNDAGTPTAMIETEIISVARLADIAAADPEFMEVAAVYRDDPAFNVPKLVEDLVKAENVPLLPILRYKPAGLRKREQWEETWELQRREDAGETVGDIPVPPKYKSSDFISTGGARYWALRGKLDVPKERWISFPHCPGSDGTLTICWAGYDHLQQALAISAHYQAIKEEQGGDEDPRLIPLLACIAELIPWLRQWHSEPNADFGGLSMADYFENEFLATEARALNLTLEEIKAWQPPARTTRRRRSAT